MASDQSTGVQWRDWSEEAFQEAEREDKLILLDISASWCHWCHVMDRTTYADDRVIKMLNEKFVPIKVDADRRPDIQDRYLLGGWPTTAFLLPDGRILTGTTFVPPDAMLQKLNEVYSLYRDQKAVVTMHVSSMAAEAEADRARMETPSPELVASVIDAVAQVLKREFDPIYGGFGNEPKFPYPDAVRFALRQYRKTGDQQMLEIARKTLDNMIRLFDPVWGGFYRYSVTRDWGRPHYEKLLYVQASLLDNYLEAYQVTGDDRYGEIAAGMEQYLARFLSDRERGGFYGSQDADVGGHDPHAEMIVGDDYYPKNEEQRLKIGMPYVDKTIYTDWNGMMISAYFRMYQAMGDMHARDFALKTVDRILAECMVDGRMAHYFDEEPRLFGVLSDQVYFGLALVDAYQCTGTRRYLAEAEKLVAFMESSLQDVMDGGFYFQVFDTHARGELQERHKPFDENVAAAQLLTHLHHLTGVTRYRELAERTLRAIGYPQLTENILGAGYAIALDTFLSPPVRIVLVGRKDAQETRKMLEASLHAYEPLKIVQVLDPAEESLTVGDLTYEAQAEPLAYVCVQNVCHEPVKGSDNLTVLLEDVIGGTP